MRRFERLMVIVAVMALPAAARPAAAQAAAPPATQSGASQQADQSAQALRAELDRLRQEFEGVKQQYGDRLAALDARLAAIEAGKPAPPPAAPPSPPAAAAPPPAQVSEAAPQAAPPAYSNPAAVSKVFNPDIAVIGDFLGAAGRNSVAPNSAGLEMHETELSFQAVVDPYAKADFFLTLGPDGGLNVEEGYLTFTSLPGGFLVKVGKLHSAFGKVNQMHNHVLPWTDRPLVTENLVGGEDGVSDAGLSVARLIPNRWMFLEATAEAYRGESAIFHAPSRGDLTYVGHLRGYRDLSDAANIDLGTSVAYGHNGVSPDSTTRLIGVDATFRYRPLRTALYQRFLTCTELVWSRRSELTGKPLSFGAYVSGEYQLARRWVAGLRLDYADRATDPALTDKGGSVILTFWPSEFSQVRGQLRRTRYAEGVTANEFLFQFLFAIGAHGAHAF